MSHLIPLAALCGYVASEAWSIIPAIKNDASTPDRFSFKYYFSRPLNIVRMVFNAACTLGLTLGHGELLSIMHKIPVIGPYFEGAAMPIITGMLIGFFAARVISWIVNKAGGLGS